MDRIISGVHPITCWGRDSARKEVLKEPVKISVWVQSLEYGKQIELNTSCTLLVGGICTASGRGDERVPCAYIADIPTLVDEVLKLSAR